MTKKIIAVNAGPRRGWNTDSLIMEAAKGAESAGAEVQNSTCSDWRSTLDVSPVSVANGRRTRATASVATDSHPC